MKQFFNTRWLLFGAVSFLAFACDPAEEDTKPVASFQFEADADDFRKVQFTNFSKNAESYSWNFGDDSDLSTDEDPLHTFPGAGEYTVELTANGADGTSAKKTSVVTVVDPNEALTLLTGNESKTWKLYREGTSMQLGPDAGNPGGWWSGLTNNGSRNCLYTQTFTFNRDGSYEFDDMGSFWAEFGVFNGLDYYETCFDATAANMILADGKDVSAWLSATHAFEYNASAGTIELTGQGAWIGIPKLGTSGETGSTIGNSVSFKATITQETGYDLMTVLFDYGTGGLWTFVYASYSDESLEPALSGPLAKPSFTSVVTGLTAAFTNTSLDCDTYSWDFGDGSAASTAASPSHTYAAAGAYTVVLTGTNAGGSVTSSANLAVGAQPLTLADLTGGSTRTWKLKSSAGAIRVGDGGPGAGNWWSIPLDVIVNERGCMWDDEFKFSSTGNFTYDAKGQVFAEGYMGGGNCIDESALAGVFTGLRSNATHTFELIPGTGGGPVKIKANGTGAFIGFSKAINGAEYDNDATKTTALSTSITYDVISIVNDNGVLTLDIGVQIAGAGWWSFTLVAQ